MAPAVAADLDGGGMSDLVETLLAAAGLPAHPAEVSGHAVKYPDLRAAVDALYAIPEARYAVPATRFDARPGEPGWEQ
ncbi:hypothetical protein NBRGN_099_00520 [Nocardia brasiliensis NBRC 14402]|uniref:hypothetical protein n=1 Tax=Nocardia brasiliensis TaxID=37326 RepID=UPI000303CCB5|nr:hypothetical protein [Nocardia brasiliensis]GAJ85829.1 hypothetical protein NBRGN_099_00520 [Nocardia brasiliensis NBRC 14402]SUB40949.1 Uncharacterised protein [Nocardia brasiliensis]